MPSGRRGLALTLVYRRDGGRRRRLLVPSSLRAYRQSRLSIFPRFLRRGRPGRGAGPIQAAACRSTPLNLLFSIVPLSMEPDRFDSFSHQFGPIFLLFLPALFLRARSQARLGAGTARLSFLDILLDAAPEHAIPAHFARAVVDRRRVPGECLVPAKNLAARCLLRHSDPGSGIRSGPGDRAGTARALDLARARVGR